DGDNGLNYDVSDDSCEDSCEDMHIKEPPAPVIERSVPEQHHTASVPLNTLSTMLLEMLVDKDVFRRVRSSNSLIEDEAELRPEYVPTAILDEKC
uniref:Uncharacterized protein n=1 Tax=Amphimedon queenslandica TaxID=400682 RepID=A0A1X7U273_AMPQE